MNAANKIRICRCKHSRNVHRRGREGCGIIGCRCPEFRRSWIPRIFRRWYYAI